ncbi:hypothetical protein ACFWVC_09360 [Streptomyces sp. NPDC058691]|uniref:hypothetical protein n=1 Tax=Streptomyces sp. NPDC058691 TaxID=3346601 RepID=UPI00365ECB0A
MSRGALWTGVVVGLAVGMVAGAVPHALAWGSEGLDVAMATVAMWAALRLASDREGPWWVMGALALALVSLGVAAYGLEEVPRYADLVPVPVVAALLVVGGVGSVWARRREVTVGGAALGAGALLAAAWLPLWAAVAVWAAAQAGSTSRTSLRTR